MNNEKKIVINFGISGEDLTSYTLIDASQLYKGGWKYKAVLEQLLQKSCDRYLWWIKI